MALPRIPIGGIGGERLLRHAPAVCRVVAYAAAACVVSPILYHLARGSRAYLGLFEDDYFYYSIIADKLASLGRLTYDATTTTNGFHPLWFLVLLALRWISGSLGPTFYVLLSVVVFGSMVASYELARRFARAIGASPALAAAAAALPSVATDRLVASGMETALDVPLLLWLFVEVARTGPLTPRRAARLGFVASLAILARLDIGLAVALGVAGWWVIVRPPASRAALLLLCFCAAGVLVPIYAAFNWVALGSPFPVSAMAKQLVVHPGISLAYFRTVAFNTIYGHLAGPVLVGGTCAAFAIGRGRAYRAPEPFFAGALALAFAAAFIGINALSGWMCFGWYAYPLAAALVAALTFLGQFVAPRLTPGMRAQAAAAAVALAVLVPSGEGIAYFVTRGPLWSVGDNNLFNMSVELAERMRGREGKYAMGAIAGFVAYSLDQPVVQLEGLAADRAMVDHVRREDDLVRVLEDYGVDYLVVSLHRAQMEEHDGCYTVFEPNEEWAGKRTAKMHGEICSPRIEHFVTHTPGHPWSIFDPLETYVFDVRRRHEGEPRHASGGAPPERSLP